MLSQYLCLLSRGHVTNVDCSNNKVRVKPSLSSQWSLTLRLLLFCLSHLSLRAKSDKTDAKEVSYEASCEAPMTTLQTNPCNENRVFPV